MQFYLLVLARILVVHEMAPKSQALPESVVKGGQKNKQPQECPRLHLLNEHDPTLLITDMRRMVVFSRRLRLHRRGLWTRANEAM